MNFSIILPVKNGGEYVKQCIQSILDQTFSEFNVIVFDSGSTDGSLEWIRRLKNDRITIYSTDRPLSIEQNWARIKDVPKNEFITIIGHDDILDREYLATMDELISQHPAASLYQAHFRFINSNGEQVRKCKPMPSQFTAAEFVSAIFTHKLDTMGTGYMMRAKDYDKVGGIPSYPGLLFADHALWMKLTAINYIVISRKECFSFRIHQSVSKSTAVPEYIHAFFKFGEFLSDFKNKSAGIAFACRMYAHNYIDYYCTSLSHRLLKTPLSQRKGMTVGFFIKQCELMADRIVPSYPGRVGRNASVLLAKIIDSNPILRKLYLMLRKIYSKPFYSR